MRHLLIILLLLASGTLNLYGEKNKVAQKVQETARAEGTVDILIFLNEKADLTGTEMIPDRVERIRWVYDTLRYTALQSQTPFYQKTQDLIDRMRAFYIVNAVGLKNATAEEIQRLANMPEVAFISGDFEMALDLPEFKDTIRSFDEPLIPGNLTYVKADRVWSELGVYGQNIVVGIQDTGIQWTHEAIVNQYRGNLGDQVIHDYSWHDAVHSTRAMSPICPDNSPEPCDDNGHGTHVTGTILGNDGGNNIIGVAPHAQWIGCRNMDHGVGTPTTYLECFEFFLAPYPYGGDPLVDGDPAMAPHVINNSWGCPSQEGCRGHEFIDAVHALQQAGIMVVAAAGNDGPSCGTVQSAPGFYSNDILSVAALSHTNGSIAYFSSRGPSRWDNSLGANISAPGVNVRSSVPGSGNNRYGSSSGTSMASPHVVGVVALLWSGRPELIGDIATTRDLIFMTADPKTATQNCGPYLGNAIPNAVYGYGAINAYEALTR